jgi:hypothetical protein
MKELQKQLQSRQPTAYTGGGRRPVSPIHNFQESRTFARTAGRSKYQGPSRYGHGPESSQQAGGRHYVTSYRPQNEWKTLAPRRDYPPRPYHSRQAPLPPRWNSWACQEWQPRDFERNQYHAKEQQHEHVTGIPPAQQRQASQEVQRPKDAPTQVASL